MSISCHQESSGGPRIEWINPRSSIRFFISNAGVPIGCYTWTSSEGRDTVADRSADVDPAETAEWLDALESVFRSEGIERGHYLIERLIDQARRSGAHLP